MTLSVLSFMIFILCVTVKEVWSSNNTTQFENFTIEWTDFNILICAVPTTIDFQQSTCQSTSASTMISTNTEGNPSQLWSTASSIVVPNNANYVSITTVTTISAAVSRVAPNTINGYSSIDPSQTAISNTQQPSITIPNGVNRVSVAVGVTTVSTAASVRSTTTGMIIYSSSIIPLINGIQQTSISANTLPSTTTPSSYSSCPENTIGPFCNISSDACAMSQPCFNAATCYINYTLPLGYQCECQSGYAGMNCEHDVRICREDTCWNNGSCIEINTTISNEQGVRFHCTCQSGYTSIHCELQIDVCANITCENRGICQNINMTWKCTCLDASLFYGDHCQYQTTSLKIKQALSRSLTSVGISVIVLTCAFIVTMDILTYCFHIDPASIEREKWYERKRIAKSNAPKTIIHFHYIP